MNSTALPTCAALAIQFGLGLVVFQANRRRESNQCFLLLSAVISAWLTSVYYGLNTRNPAVAEFCIREASAAGALILAGFNLLRLSIREREKGWRGILHHSRAWLVITIAIVGLCQTKSFLTGARIPEHDGTAALLLPSPIYGPAFPVYSIYFVTAIVVLLITTTRDMRSNAGSDRAELAFILIGGILALTMTVPLNFVLGFFVEPSRLMWFAPFKVVLFSVVVAYGIATRKIMDVGAFLRRTMSYAVLAVYLLTLYGLAWWLVDVVFSRELGPPQAQTLAHVVAAVTIAFAMAPARGFSQRLADRLFISSRGLDFGKTMNQAAAILNSVTTLRDLLERFASTIGQAVNTDRVIILLAQKEVYGQQYPPPKRESKIELPRDHPLLAYLKSSQQPIVLDELHRVRATPEVHRIINQMQHLDLAVVMGIFARDQLEGVMLLGPRLSRRIYGSVEQSALQVLCGQLAVAIENAELFTEVQNAKLYNETLLENLTTGVVAVSANGTITVFNNEAGKITELNPREMIDQSLNNLPQGVCDLLRETLQSSRVQENSELTFASGEQDKVVRASSSIFHDQEGKILGALMVLTDITALKRLELQIRRSDRLASLGTLSAGMAHEIKNPLVSIKTFAQLLPERYLDSDFRETFSNLIGHEIDRIDSLVNQLLRFARPAKPHLKPMHVHDVLEKSLMLVGHRLYQKEIKLTRSWDANVDTIRADADQLEQVFLNFFLNAIEAMKGGGELTVATEICPAEQWAIPGTNGDVREVLRVTIRDSGEGIRREDIPHVFDPFFTTKDYGTGLGLSVVHGIIQEHGGQIEVESELAKGTAFHILLPLVRFHEEVAAA
jgi:PAS domain S-box-containing protein